MNLRKALSVFFIIALVIANASLISACKDEEGGAAEGGEAPAEMAPPAEEAPADHGHDHGDGADHGHEHGEEGGGEEAAE